MYKICRFPFDVQSCSIALIFGDYVDEEVQWTTEANWAKEIDCEGHVNAAWQQLRNITKVEQHIVT